MEADSWIESEFWNNELSDKRLRTRLLKVAAALSENPEAPINQANKDWAATKAAYRLFGNERIKAEDIIKTHRQSTIERMKEYELVLAIQDTTYLSYPGHKACEGLGYIGSEELKGIVAHNTLVCSTEGLPLGLFDQKLYTRQEFQGKGRSDRRSRPIEEKESIRWLESVRKIAEEVEDPSRVVTVCDREGDFTDLLHEINTLGMRFLIRATYKRAIASEKYKTSFEAVEKAKKAGSVKIEVPPRGGSKGYQVVADVRYTKLTITSRERDYPTLELWMVYVSGKSASGERLKWYLLTNVEVFDLNTAIERIQWYRLRWHIELFHKVLKSGCKVEDFRLGEVHRLYKCITLYSIISWRLLSIVYINRCTPELPVSIILSQTELRALQVLAQKEYPSIKIKTIGDAITVIAKLGGYLARKSDKAPGIIVIWRGWQRLYDAASFLAAWESTNCG